VDLFPKENSKGTRRHPPPAGVIPTPGVFTSGTRDPACSGTEAGNVQPSRQAEGQLLQTALI